MKQLLGLAAALLLGLVWLGPLPALAQQAFSAHMLMHVAVIAVAAPLLGGALAGTRFDPVLKWPTLVAPPLAAAVELVVVWGWHAPGPHNAARGSTAVLALEQLSYLAAGLLVWLAALGGDLQRRAVAGAAGLLLTSMHMTLLGVLLALAGRSLYQHGGDVHNAFALVGGSALNDQEVGGLIMLFFGGSTYLVGGLYLLHKLLNPTTKRRHARV